MRTDFTTDIIWMSTLCAVSLVNQVRAAADVFCPVRIHQPTEQLRGDLHKSEVLLIARILLVVKAEIYIGLMNGFRPVHFVQCWTLVSCSCLDFLFEYCYKYKGGLKLCKIIDYLVEMEYFKT